MKYRQLIAFALLAMALIIHGCSTENRGGQASTNTIVIPKVTYSDR